MQAITETRILTSGNLASLLKRWTILEPDTCKCLDYQQAIYWARSPEPEIESGTIHAIRPREIKLAWLQRVVMRSAEKRGWVCDACATNPGVYGAVVFLSEHLPRLADADFLGECEATDPAIAMLAAYLEALKNG